MTRINMDMEQYGCVRYWITVGLYRDDIFSARRYSVVRLRLSSESDDALSD